MNRYQVAFVSSFLCTFVGLYALSAYVGAKLRAAGYDISQLILIGLPKNGSVDMTLNGQSPGLDFSVLLAPLGSLGYARIAALLFGAFGGLFLLTRFSGTSAPSSLLFFPSFPICSATQSRKQTVHIP